jgi:acetoin utilization deacetylase AcuC-like enzyme
MTLAIYTHPDCLTHDTGRGHPECIDRLCVILDALRAAPFAGKLAFVEAPLATEADLLLAHDARHIRAVQAAAPAEGYAYLDADTVMSPGSLKAALRAAGSGCAAVDAVMAGKYKTAFCAVRPPGHHAERDRPMGFCLFNNIAIAALHALQKHRLERVAIVDFDVHHGNGTQDIVTPEKRVLFISTHQSPFYPGTGFATENETGHILNLPLPQGTDGEAYRDIFKESILPALEKFKPQLLLVSAGFDAHLDDPLAGLELVEDDYRWIGEQLTAFAEKHCQGRMISFLEGGYNLEHLASSVVAYLSASAKTVA